MNVPHERRACHLLAGVVVMLSVSSHDRTYDHEQDIQSEHQAGRDCEVHPHPGNVPSRADGMRTFSGGPSAGTFSPR